VLAELEVLELEHLGDGVLTDRDGLADPVDDKCDVVLVQRGGDARRGDECERTAAGRCRDPEPLGHQAEFL